MRLLTNFFAKSYSSLLIINFQLLLLIFQFLHQYFIFLELLTYSLKVLLLTFLLGLLNCFLLDRSCILLTFPLGKSIGIFDLNHLLFYRLLVDQLYCLLFLLRFIEFSYLESQYFVPVFYFPLLIGNSLFLNLLLPRFFNVFIQKVCESPTNSVLPLFQNCSFLKLAIHVLK